MTGWDDFMHWGERILADVDLESMERGYKLAHAEKLRLAFEACERNSEDWPVLLKRGFGGSNLVDSYTQMWARNAIDNHPEEARRAFLDLRNSALRL